MDYGYGTVGNTSVHHVILGGWKGPLAQFGNQKQNAPACAPTKRCGRRIVKPDSDRMCQACVRIVVDQLEKDKVIPAQPPKPVPVAPKPVPTPVTVTRAVPPTPAVMPAFRPAVHPRSAEDQPVEVEHEVPAIAERRFVQVKRSQCFVAHPWQRDVLNPPWPKRWGDFDLAKFYASLEPVTVIKAERVDGLEDFTCPDHGKECLYTVYPDAEYLVLGGQHRTLEGGRVFGEDWVFQAVEIDADVSVQDLHRRWWVTEERRSPGSRQVFARKVQDGDQEFVDMGYWLNTHGFTWRRARRGDNELVDFTCIGSFPSFWHRDKEAAKVTVEVLQQAGPLGKGETWAATTRMPLVRAIFEMVCWDLSRTDDDTRVRWVTGYGTMANKLSTLGGKVTSAEQAMGIAGGTAWERVANYLAEQYNKGRSTGYVNFPTF